MAQLLHPAFDEITLEHVFYALSDKNRLLIVGNLYRCNRQMTCQEAAAGIPELPNSTRSHCFKMLREYGLIRSEKRGRECFNSLRLDELESEFPGLMDTIVNLIDTQDVEKKGANH